MNNEVEHPVYFGLDDKSDAVWLMNREGSILTANSRADEIFGFSRTLEPNPLFVLFLAENDLGAAQNSFRLAKRGKPQRFEVSCTRDGVTSYFSIKFVPCLENNQIEGIYGIATNISAQKKNEADLQEARDIIKDILGSISDGFLAIDSDWRVLTWNQEAERIIGKTSSELSGKVLWEVYPQAVQTSIFTKLHKGMYENVNVQFESYDGASDRWFSIHANPSKRGLSVYFRDITERKKTEQQIATITYFDPLTGLPNQTLFKERLAQFLNRSKRTNDPMALLFLDMDRFKLVNDSFGFDLGDQLIVNISKRLALCLREDDTVCRYSGDHFAVLLRKVSRGTVRDISERILEEFQKPFVIENTELVMTPSIGISFYPTDGVEAENLLAHADTALRRAKAEGKNGYRFYDPEMNESSLLVMEGELRKALLRDELLLFYQPQVDMLTGKAVGAEALIRWNHPEWGIVSPDKFIRLAEETGLVVPMSEWVLTTACKQNKAWQDQGYVPMSISVNLSPRNFSQGNVVDAVKKALETSGLEPRFLDLEITESMTMSVEGALVTLQELKSLGVRISIDDFGKGYSSLSYLKMFPIDILKIDQSFVRECTVDANDATLVKTIIAMAHDLKLNVIAEGVETVEQFSFLKEHECNEAQGYLFSKPVPAEQFQSKMQEIPKLWKTTG